MIDIRPLTTLAPEDLRRIVSGYSSSSKYNVEVSESGGQVSFTLNLVELDEPYVKEFDLTDIKRYKTLLRDNCSFGVYDRDLLVGLALGEIRLWNRTLWMHEFHLLENYRNQGIGKRLMEEVLKRGKQQKLRAIVCETQNTNTPAIGFYRNLEFRIEGVDISYYSNIDFPDGEIAIFMKRRLE